MSDGISSLIVIVVTGIFVAALFLYLNHRKKQEIEALARLVAENGWSMTEVRERLVSGYQLTGAVDGTAWFFESLAISQDAPAAPGSSETRIRTCWRCDAIGLANGMAAIGPRMAGAGSLPEMSGFQGVLMQKALRLVFGEDADLLAEIKPVECGSAAFQQHYMVWANHEVDAERLIRSISEGELLKYTGDQRLLIKLGKDGLEISIPQGKRLPPSTVKKFISLGENIVRYWRH